MPKTKSKSKLARGEIRVLRELSFMNELTKLVEKRYPRPDGESDGELFRIFNWALSRFSPEPKSAAHEAISFAKKYADQLLAPPTVSTRPPTFITGLPSIPPRPRPAGTPGH